MKTTNKYKFHLLIFSLFLSLFAMAQPDMDEDMDEGRKEKIESLKRAFIADKLELTVAQSEKFWPMYNEFNTARQGIRKSIRAAVKKMKESAKTEKELIEQLDLITAKRKEEIDLETKFVKDCVPVLGVEKSMKLAGLEKEFQFELMEKLRDKRHDGHGPPPPPPGGRHRD